jgi:hypothetical protein
MSILIVAAAGMADDKMSVSEDPTSISLTGKLFSEPAF